MLENYRVKLAHTQIGTSQRDQEILNTNQNQRDVVENQSINQSEVMRNDGRYSVSICEKSLGRQWTEFNIFGIRYAFPLNAKYWLGLKSLDCKEEQNYCG